MLTILLTFFYTINSAFAEINSYFTDVPPNHWACEAIHSMIAKGIITGYPDYTFRPDNKVTRYEFAAMLARALGLPIGEKQGVKGEKPYFSDYEPSDSWAKPYAEAVRDYMPGFWGQNGKREFRGSDFALRETVIVALVKAKNYNEPLQAEQRKDLEVMELNPAPKQMEEDVKPEEKLKIESNTEKGKETDQEVNFIVEDKTKVKVNNIPGAKFLQDRFSDYDQISPENYAYVATAVQKGLIKGFPNGTLQPHEKLTRAQAAVLIYRAFNESEEKEKLLTDLDITNLPNVLETDEQYRNLAEKLAKKYGTLTINETTGPKNFKFEFFVSDININNVDVMEVFINLKKDSDQDQYFRFLPVYRNNNESILNYVNNVAGDMIKEISKKNLIIKLGFYRSYYWNPSNVFEDDMVSYNPTKGIFEVQRTFIAMLFEDKKLLKEYANKDV